AIAVQLGVRNMESKAELIEKITTACLSIAEHEIHKLEEEPEHSLLQQYQDSTDLEDVRMQEETVMLSKRTIKKRKVEQPDGLEMRSLLEEIKELRRDMSDVNNDYNTLRSIGKDLDLALNADSAEEACSFIELAKKRAKDRMTILRVANEYGWDVAVELPQSKYNDQEDDTEAINNARQIAAKKKRKKRHTITEKQFFRRDEGYKGQNQTERGNYYEARPFVNKNTFYNQKTKFYTKNQNSRNQENGAVITVEEL
ncbi:3799_t:CDS:2, partial [Acaulospora morrowiae]